MRWLRRFLASPDPAVKLVTGLSEPEARMLTELLENDGITAAARNMNFLSASYYAGSLPGDFDVYVKESDVERALDIVGPMVRPEQLAARDGE